MSKTVELIHRPFGDRHPYENAVDERVPRHPAPKEPVEIRALTRPIGAVYKVQVAYWEESQPDHIKNKDFTFSESVTTEGAVTEDGHLSEAAARAGLVVGVDRWQVSLPGFPAGTKVQYQLTGDLDSEPVVSPVYSFTVRKVISLSEIVKVYQRADSIVLVLQNAETNSNGYLHLHLADEGHLQVEAGHGSYPELEKTEYIQIEKPQGELRKLNLGTVRAEVDVNKFHLKLFYQDRLIISGVQAPKLVIGYDDAVEAVIFSFDSLEDEGFYGFGERFNALNQRGQRLDIRVYEQYKNHGLRTYMPMPLFVSSRGYGVLVNSLRHSVFDLAHDDPNRWTLKTELGNEAKVSCDILLGDQTQLLDLVSRLTAMTGLPVLPPSWAFGLWMSGNEWNSQSRVEEMVRQHEQHEIPTNVIVLEAWSDENTFYIWNDAQYEPKSGSEFFQYDDFSFPPEGLWPDPKGMIENLHKQGMRVLLWQIPVLKVNEENHAQLANDKAFMREKGYCVQVKDGGAYEIRPFWFHNGLLMDFTHPEGTEWWMQKRQYLLTELGIDGFKTDGGEHIWGRDLLFADGRESDEVWNEYPNQYAGAYFNFARKHKPDAITFSRAGFTGAQAFPCHWAGDENSTWEAFRHSILAGLNAGISGVSFWGWDFAGFSGPIPTAELYLRATAMATFCPIMQYHSEYNHHREPSNDRTPWNIQERTGDSDVVSVFRFYANLRMNLLPYIISEAWHSSQTGIPMMRAMSLAFPGDGNGRNYPYQYMFGSSLLVAPVVEEGMRQWPVYLPAGDWYDFWTGAHYSGGQEINYAVPKDRMPVFVRGGAILPLNLGDSFSLGSNVGNAVDEYQNLCFKLYPQQNGTVRWYDYVQKQSYEFSYAQELNADRLNISFPLTNPAISLLLYVDQATKIVVNDELLTSNDKFTQSGWRLYS